MKKIPNCKTNLKPGYYIDWCDDIMIVLPNGTALLMVYKKDKIIGYRRKWWSGELTSEVTFLGAL